ncbi:MAG: DNA polymerase III subunit chi [Pseudomonadota bacterium]|nr:DNA polymerase III subunit chi [Pseudomonadota bacterium]
MTEIRFYHLQKSPLEQALPRLLQKILEKGMKAVVLCGPEERVESLNQALWTYSPPSFLPHGSAADGFAADQPVWLTAREENPNGATVLVVADGTRPQKADAWDLCCMVFDGNDEAAVAGARDQWKAWKDSGHTLSYWQQTDSGWQQI